MRGSAFMASLPAGDDGPSRAARAAAVLRAVREGVALPIEWKPVHTTWNGRSATVYVASDSLRFGEPGDNANPSDWDWVRVAADARTAQQIADTLGVLLPTSKIADLAYQQADVRLTPHTQQPVTATTAAMLRHHAAVEAERAGRTGLLADVGKDWILGSKLWPASHPAHPLGREGAINYGWHTVGPATPNGPYVGHDGLILWQQEGYRHNLDHVDYAQFVPRFVRADMLLDDEHGVPVPVRTVDVLTDPKLAGLLSYEGAIGGSRYPNVPPPDAGPPSPSSSSLVSPGQAVGPASGRAPSARGPSRPNSGALLIGDSLAGGLAPALAALARAVRCPFRSKSVDGSHIADWDRDDSLGQALTPLPKLTLICLGANDAQGIAGASAGRRAGDLIDRVLALGSEVVWIGPPTLPFPTSDFMDALAESCAMRGVRLFDSRDVVMQRRTDGIHCTDQGNRTWAAAIAAWLPLSAYGLGGVLPPLNAALLAVATQLFPNNATVLQPGSPLFDVIHGGRRPDAFGAPSWGYYSIFVGRNADGSPRSGGTTCGVVLGYELARARWPADMINRLPTDAAPGSGFDIGMHVTKFIAGARERGWYHGAPFEPQPGDGYHADHPPKPNSDHVGVIVSVSAPRADGTREVVTVDGGQPPGWYAHRNTRILSADGRTLTLSGVPARVVGYIRADSSTGPHATPDLSWEPAPALLVLLRQLDGGWPERSKASDGILGDAAHQARASDHNTGDALDITIDSAHGPDPRALARALLLDARTHYVIFDGRIANREMEAGAWRTYPGPDPHTTHVHVSNLRRPPR